MAYYITKERTILEKPRTIYYQEDNKWTTEFSERKVYDTESEALENISYFGGVVESDD